ncbi:hypothetical protein [Bradyrhizobium tunisiense]|uniref:hypothetical protein n=1 Tax=Bradyrhizobium tunisiense TaxID=3278709 RepID=UPI0035DE3121
MKVRLERELTEPNCCHKTNMLAEPEPADSFGKASEPLSQICPMPGPAQTRQMWEERYRAVAVVAGAIQNRSAQMWRLEKLALLMIAQSLDVSICPPLALETCLSVSPPPLTVFSQLP